MTVAASEIVSLKTNTALTNATKESDNKSTDKTDKDMFLTLMLKQMEYQDPTEPTDNEQWLSQLAQYSSLEQMENLNTSFSDVGNALKDMNSTLSVGSTVSQTLSMVGKDVTLTVPADKKAGTEAKTVKGTVDEAAFVDGEGMVKVDGKYYSIGYIESVRNASASSTTAATKTAESTTAESTTTKTE